MTGPFVCGLSGAVLDLSSCSGPYRLLSARRRSSRHHPSRIPPWSSAARRWLAGGGVQADTRQQPGSQRVRVPHLASVQPIAAPDRSGHTGNQVENPPCDACVVCDSHRAPDGVGDVGDDALAPAPDLIPEEPEPSSPFRSHCALGDHPTLLSPSVANLGHLDDEPTLGSGHHESRVEQRAARAALNQGQESLVELPADPHDVRACAERNPVEVDTRAGGNGRGEDCVSCGRSGAVAVALRAPTRLEQQDERHQHREGGAALLRRPTTGPGTRSPAGALRLARYRPDRARDETARVGSPLLDRHPVRPAEVGLVRAPRWG